MQRWLKYFKVRDIHILPAWIKYSVEMTVINIMRGTDVVFLGPVCECYSESLGATPKWRLKVHVCFLFSVTMGGFKFTHLLCLQNMLIEYSLARVRFGFKREPIPEAHFRNRFGPSESLLLCHGQKELRNTGSFLTPSITHWLWFEQFQESAIVKNF